MTVPHKEIAPAPHPLQDLVPLISRVAERRRVTLEIEGSSELEVPAGLELPVIRLCYLLIVRAIRDTAPTGVVQVAAEVVPMGSHADSGRWVRVAISDTGKGMTREQLEQLLWDFRPTQVVDQEGSLGRTITCWLTELAGARLSMTAQWGEGCTLALTVPSR